MINHLKAYFTKTIFKYSFIEPFKKERKISPEFSLLINKYQNFADDIKKFQSFGSLKDVATIVNRYEKFPLSKTIITEIKSINFANLPKLLTSFVNYYSLTNEKNLKKLKFISFYYFYARTNKYLYRNEYMKIFFMWMRLSYFYRIKPKKNFNILDLIKNFDSDRTIYLFLLKIMKRYSDIKQFHQNFDFLDTAIELDIRNHPSDNIIRKLYQLHILTQMGGVALKSRGQLYQFAEKVMTSLQEKNWSFFHEKAPVFSLVLPVVLGFNSFKILGIKIDYDVLQMVLTEFVKTGDLSNYGLQKIKIVKNYLQNSELDIKRISDQIFVLERAISIF